jgi:hypothetical protein
VVCTRKSICVFPRGNESIAKKAIAGLGDKSFQRPAPVRL